MWDTLQELLSSAYAYVGEADWWWTVSSHWLSIWHCVTLARNVTSLLWKATLNAKRHADYRPDSALAPHGMGHAPVSSSILHPSAAEHRHAYCNDGGVMRSWGASRRRLCHNDAHSGQWVTLGSSVTKPLLLCHDFAYRELPGKYIIRVSWSRCWQSKAIASSKQQQQSYPCSHICKKNWYIH